MNFIIAYVIVGFVVLFTTPFFNLLKESFNELVTSCANEKMLGGIIFGIVGIISIIIVILFFVFLYPFVFLIRLYTTSSRPNFEKKYSTFQKEKAELSKKYDGITPLYAQIIKVNNHPFNFHTNQIIYFEGEHNTFLNDYFQREYKKVCAIIGTKTEYSQDVKRTFIYIPKQTSNLKQYLPNIENSLRYYFPNFSEAVIVNYLESLEHLTTSNFTNIVLQALGYNGEVYSGLFRARNSVKGSVHLHSEFSYTKIDATNDNDLEKQLYFYIDHIQDKSNDIFYSLMSKDEIISRLNSDGKSDEIADFKFDYEAHKIAEEIKSKIEQLKVSGYHELLLSLVYQNLQGNTNLSTTPIEDILSVKPKLSRIAIDKNYKIYLVDYNNLEITMTPLPKAVFILFLRHPEGILLKYISEYRKELLDIYENISYRETREEIFKSINDVTNPSSNSINEKCSRIKEAFVKHFDDSIASQYYIAGERGKEKRIILDRDLVIWNIDFKNIDNTIPLSEKQREKRENEIKTFIEVGKENLNNGKKFIAIENFTKALDLDKSNVKALFMRAIAYFQLGQYEQSEEDNTNVLTIVPDYDLCFHNRAESRFMMKNFKDALNDITYYLSKFNNKCKDSYYLRGLIREELGDINNACQDWYNASHLGHEAAKTALLKYPKIKIKKKVFEVSEKLRF